MQSIISNRKINLRRKTGSVARSTGCLLTTSGLYFVLLEHVTTCFTI